MPYSLRSHVLGSGVSLRLIKNEFDRARTDIATVLNSLMIEYVFDLLCRSYVELESAVSQTGIDHMVLGIPDYQSFQLERQKLALRLGALLTCARMYLDGCAHHAGALEGAFKAAASVEYDTHFSYRLMEQLRNHAQHLGDIVHGLTLRSSWKGEEEDRHLVVGITISANKEELEKNAKLNAKFRRELADVTDRIDLIANARRYVESLFRIQKHLRELLGADLKAAIVRLNSLAASFKSKVKKDTAVVLVAVKTDEDGTQEDHFDIVEDVWQMVHYLQRRNRCHPNISRAFVSGAIEGPRSGQA